MIRVYLIRHGSTDSLQSKIHQTPENPLSDLGKEQARKVAVRLADLPIEALYASPWTRARQTAEIIQQQLQVPLQFWLPLHEVRRPTQMWDKPTNHPQSELIYAQMDEQLLEKGDPDWRYSDEETFTDYTERAVVALHRLERLPHQHVGVVTHHFFIKVLLAKMLFGDRLTPELWMCIYRGLTMQPTGVTVCDYTPETGKWQLVCWNDHRHLP